MNLNIKYNNLLDIINLHFGVYYPLKNFVSKKDFLSIINNYKLENKIFFPLPVYINISTKLFNRNKNIKTIKAFYKSEKVCDLNVKSFYSLNKNKIGQNFFKTRDINHPGFKEFLKSGEYFIDCKIRNFNHKIMNNLNFSYPAKIKSIFKENKVRTIVGFHTRNAPHRAHEWIHNYGLRYCDGLLIHPLIGQFKENEYTEKAILKTNSKLVKKIYNKKNIFFAFFNSYPRYAGPREALFHALVRKNYGCTHFLVGRDHAGVKDFYKKYESQKICLKFQKKLKIKIVIFDEPYLCIGCKNIVNKKCYLCKKATKKLVSGTLIRKRLLKKMNIPSYIMRKEISSILSNKSIISNKS